MKLLISVVVPLLVLSNSAGVGSNAASAQQHIPEKLCSAKVVFLGEASHGGGETIRAKVDMTQALIDQCHFNQVAFESQMYDFTALHSPHITVNALRNAIGGLWSTTGETDALFERLVGMANRNEIRVQGIDGQLGSSTSRYAQAQFAADLTAGMPRDRAKTCSDLTNRLTQWSFDETHPKDDQFDKDLKHCAEAFVAHAKQSGAPEQIALAKNFDRFLSFSNDNYVNDRDMLMFENLQRMIKPNTKTVVWTANIHAAREGVSDVHPLASHFGPTHDVVSVGFTAIDGAYCMPPCKSQKVLAPASAESLERYVTGLGKRSQLFDLKTDAAATSRPSKLLDYSKETTEQWSRLFDYVFVLPKERAPNHVRSASPLPE